MPSTSVVPQQRSKIDKVELSGKHTRVDKKVIVGSPASICQKPTILGHMSSCIECFMNFLMYVSVK